MERLETRALLSATINEFPILPEIYGVLDMTVGPDGAFWFTEDGRGQIGRLDPSTGAITEFPAPRPQQITTGSDGALWFTESGANNIGRLTTDGTLTQFPLPTGIAPNDIVSGPDGNLWFSSALTKSLGRITLDGQVTTFPVSDLQQSITVGPDDNIWFTTFHTIGKVTADGHVTEYAMPGNDSANSITAGPDDNLWFTESLNNKVGRITLDGTITEFTTPTPLSTPDSIVGDVQGNLWFTEAQANQVARMTTDGVITEFPIPTSMTQPQRIVAGRDGNIWFVERQTSAIGELVVDNPLRATGVDVSAPWGTAWSGVVATFQSTDPDSTASDFSAHVDWADGTSSLATITPDGQGGFQVTADHTFSANDRGFFSIEITTNNAPPSAWAFGNDLLNDSGGGGGSGGTGGSGDTGSGGGGAILPGGTSSGGGAGPVVIGFTNGQPGQGSVMSSSTIIALVERFRDALMHSAQMNSRLRHPRGPLAISHTQHHHVTHQPVHHPALPISAGVHHAAQVHHASSFASGLRRLHASALVRHHA